jgi:hypothetical protein
MTRVPSTWPEIDFELVQPQGATPPTADDGPFLRASTLAPDGTPLAIQADLRHVAEEQARGMLAECLRALVGTRLPPPTGQETAPGVAAHPTERRFEYVGGVDFQRYPGLDEG